MRTLSFSKPSTNVSEAKHDPKTGVLTVVFENGSSYRYANVSEEQAAAWEKSDSVGKWFNSNIKAKTKEHPVIREGEAAPEKAEVEPESKPETTTPSSSRNATAPERASSAVNFQTVTDDVLADGKASYLDYANNCGGKTFDGRDMPTWDELLEKKSPVVSHWCAVALGARKRYSTDASVALESERNNTGRLTVKIRELEERNIKLGRHAGQADANAVEAAARERTKTLEDEVDKLREEKAALEAELAKKPKPERPWRNHERG